MKHPFDNAITPIANDDVSIISAGASFDKTAVYIPDNTIGNENTPTKNEPDFILSKSKYEDGGTFYDFLDLR